MTFALQKFLILIIPLSLSVFNAASGQYLENFDEVPPQTEWRTAAGDGQAVSTLEWSEGSGSIIVDATADRRNIWWAIMQTTVSDSLDLEQLAQPGYELRIETRIRSSHAPRRVNLHLNTQRTVDFHTYLMEFDIPDTVNWHTISMTTRNFNGNPGDVVNAHLALMDWGTGRYRVDMDYFRVDVVKLSEARPDSGEQVAYPPPVPQPAEFAFFEPVAEAGMIDEQYPDVNFSGWIAGNERVLTASGSKLILLRWDLNAYTNQNAANYGMLELTPHSFYRATGIRLPEFTKIRLVEILGGNPNWVNEEVTLHNFTKGRPLESVLNSQMIIDVEIPDDNSSPLYIHIPRPVIQRLLEARTKGIAIYPLGAASASFYPGEDMSDPVRSRLYFNLD